MQIQNIQSQENKIWRSESYRLTVFFNNTGKIDDFNWWESIVGETPEKRNAEPRLGVFQDEGRYSDGYLVISTQPGRADLVFFPSFDTLAGMPEFKELPEYHTSKDLFSNLASQFFKVCPPIVRVAFGLILSIPVANSVSGYHKLSEYLKTVQINHEKSKDFLYQINYPRLSKQVKNLHLNRLSKWSVASVANLQIPLTQVLPNLRINNDFQYFARLELDINTVPEYVFVDMTSEIFLLVYLELIDLAFEIAEKGEVI